jgi:hypothetical protein
MIDRVDCIWANQPIGKQANQIKGNRRATRERQIWNQSKCNWEVVQMASTCLCHRMWTDSNRNSLLTLHGSLNPMFISSTALHCHSTAHLGIPYLIRRLGSQISKLNSQVSFSPGHPLFRSNPFPWPTPSAAVEEHPAHSCSSWSHSHRQRSQDRLGTGNCHSTSALVTSVQAASEVATHPCSTTASPFLPSCSCPTLAWATPAWASVDAIATTIS